MSTATVLKDGVMYPKITKELYIKHKKAGESDSRIMRRYGMYNQSLSDWKQLNFTDDEIQNLKIKGKGGRPPVKKDKPQGKPVHTFDKELKQALAELKELKKVNEHLSDELKDVKLKGNELKKENEDLASRVAFMNVEDNSELENLKAACSDLENETNSLQRKLIEKDYEITNLDYAFESLNQRMDAHVKENKALKELVRLWI
ncbi:hypothetical protein KHA93_02900 [Bacillus sp. FJAT-49732]|uniref:Uncharacterized protein n=1 Tax=Lederbergia citrisecunda TaxID=2833583 RepID=A0A942TIA9_9BACI|nr:hypothetical protein [Lederbergia citrisecunda]MBS4198596.1 hypothetical protein [Lederbergia citrisecunda]